MERAFVEAYCGDGVSAREAAKRAGFASSASGFQLIRRPEVAKLIHEYQTAWLKSEGYSMAAAMVRRMLDPEEPGVPWNTRLGAAKVVFEQVTGKVAEGASKPLSEMTRDELADRLGQLQGELADRSKPVVIEAEPIDDQDESSLFE